MKKKSHLRVACIQINAGADWEQNWLQTEKQLRIAARSQVDVIVLPENFIIRASDEAINLIEREVVPLVLHRLKAFSRKHRITLVAGSVPERLNSSHGKKSRTANTCFVFSAEGKQLLRYRKMHLFDVDLPQVRVQESKTIQPGKIPGFFKVKEVGMGVGICYDLRFPEYFRVLSGLGSEVLFVPANFTAETGKTAWEVLLRARAIENQCYVVASGQWGRHPGSGIISYGNSRVIDPLGKVLKRASFGKSHVLIADLDLADLRNLRRCFPVLQHRTIRRF